MRQLKIIKQVTNTNNCTAVAMHCRAVACYGSTTALLRLNSLILKNPDS